MSYFVLSLLVQVALVVHVIKTGRNTLWIWVLVLLPMLGSIGYVLVEIVPGLLGSRATQGVLKGVRRAIDPNRELRQATTRAAIVDTVATKARLGAELTRRGDYAAAIATYRAGLRGIYEHDPTLVLGLAEAQFAAGDAPAARASLDALLAYNSGFSSADGHLLYARALEAEGNLTKAEAEYQAVSRYFPGAEAKVRYAQLLRKAGKAQAARTAFEEVLKMAELAPRHVLRTQAEWLAIAKRERNG